MYEGDAWNALLTRRVLEKHSVDESGSQSQMYFSLRPF